MDGQFHIILDGFRSYGKNAQGKKGEIPGNLEVVGGIFTVKFLLNFTSKQEYVLVKGLLETTFAALNVQVPDVAGGLVAQPKELLELLAQLRSDKISGADKLIIYK